MISTLKAQSLETGLIEKIKAAIKKRAEAKAKRLFLKRPQRLAKRKPTTLRPSRIARSFSRSVSRKVATTGALTASRAHHRRPRLPDPHSYDQRHVELALEADIRSNFDTKKPRTRPGL